MVLHEIPQRKLDAVQQQNEREGWIVWSLQGQSIAEHYRIGLGPDAGETDPTNSTYFLAENILGFNTGYHDEHHTFPKVAWARLPELKRRFPDEFGKHVNPRRYLDLWFDWAIHGFETGYFRMCKK